MPLTGHEGRKHVAPQIPSQPNNATDKAPHEDSCRALPGALRPRSSQLRLRSRVRGALNSGRGAGGAWTVVKAPDFCGRCALLPQMSPGGGIGPLPCPRQGAHPVVGASGRHGAPPPRASGPPSRPPCLLPCAGLNSPPGTSAPARNTLPATHVTQTPCFAPGSRRGRLVASSVATGSVPAATSLFVGMEEKAPRKTMKSEWRGIQVSGRGFGGRSGRHSGRSPAPCHVKTMPPMGALAGPPVPHGVGSRVPCDLYPPDALSLPLPPLPAASIGRCLLPVRVCAG